MPDSRCSESDVDAAINVIHRRYRLGAILGSGAFAQVYAARSEQAGSEGKDVAVKVSSLRGSMLRRINTDQRALDRVEREARLLTRIAGLPHCISMLEHAVEGGVSYVVMERCECSLAFRLQNAEGLTEAAFAQLVQQMLQALAEIHDRSVVHRDVKADNFLWTGTVVKLCDFGCAQFLPPGKELNAVYGTAPYISPEMLNGSGYGTGTDVWSLGVLVYVVLFGEFPNSGRQKTKEAMEEAILSGEPGPSYHLALQGVKQPSGSVQKFLRLALMREKDLRDSAKELLGHPWLSQPNSEQDRPLQAAVMSAKRAGAFQPRDQTATAPHATLDAYVRQRQEQYQRAGEDDSLACGLEHGTAERKAAHATRRPSEETVSGGAGLLGVSDKAAAATRDAGRHGRMSARKLSKDSPLPTYGGSGSSTCTGGSVSSWRGKRRVSPESDF